MDAAFFCGSSRLSVRRNCRLLLNRRHRPVWRWLLNCDRRHWRHILIRRSGRNGSGRRNRRCRRNGRGNGLTVLLRLTVGRRCRKGISLSAFVAESLAFVKRRTAVIAKAWHRFNFYDLTLVIIICNFNDFRRNMQAIGPTNRINKKIVKQWHGKFFNVRKNA